MTNTINFELLKELFEGFLEGGECYIKYGNTVYNKRYHINIFQRIINKIFRTSFQSEKTIETKQIIISWYIENKCYNVCISEDLLQNVNELEYLDEIVRPLSFRLVYAYRKNNK